MRQRNIVLIIALLIAICIFRCRLWKAVMSNTSVITDARAKTERRERRSRNPIFDNHTYRNSEWIDTLQPWIKPRRRRPKASGKKAKRLPQVICIGVKKCGTGAFHHFLTAHPRIKTVAEKEEAHFFDHTHEYKQGLGYYKSMFEEAGKRDVVFEKTPDYFTRPTVPSRIMDWNRDVKLILVLCDPVIRTFSDYVFMTTIQPLSMRKHMNFTNFDEYVDDSISDMLAIKQGDYRTLGYGTFHSFVRSAHNHRTFPLTGLTVGMYAAHLKDWYTYFPSDQIHIIDGEELISNPGEVMKDVQRFIGIDVNITENDFYWDDEKGFFYLPDRGDVGERGSFGDKGKHRGSKAEKMSEYSLSKLTKFFKPYNEKLYALLNKRFDWF